MLKRIDKPQGARQPGSLPGLAADAAPAAAAPAGNPPCPHNRIVSGPLAVSVMPCCCTKVSWQCSSGSRVDNGCEWRGQPANRLVLPHSHARELLENCQCHCISLPQSALLQRLS